jgi:cytoskeletal protein CcmA (bactofilin family)
MSMWNRGKKEDEPAYKPPANVARPAQSVSPASTEFAKEGKSMPTAPGRAYEPEMTRGTAVIGKSVIIKGQIFAREDLLVDGEVEGGTIEAQEHRLTIGPNGKVNASVKAREIVVLGAVNGNVEASEKIDIRKDARLIGDIKTARIVIEDGAYFKGSIDIQKTEVKPAPARTPVPTAEPAAVPTGFQPPERR